MISLRDSRALVANRLRANAWAVAESERTPFIIARHALTFASQQPGIRNFGPQCSKMLGNALHGAEGLINFVRADADGKVRCSALPFTPEQDVTGANWWKDSYRKRGLSLSRPEIGVISHRPVIIMALPQWAASGAFNGTLSASIGLEKMQSSLRRKTRNGRGIVMIVDARGNPVLQHGPTSFERLDNVVGGLTGPSPATARNDSPWIFVAAPLYEDELYVVYAEPRHAVMADAIAQIRFSLLLPLLAIAMTSIAIWLGTQRLLVRWLDKLHMLTSRFARGDFTGERDAYITAPTEISQFAADLHEMANAITAHERDLKSALAAKTAMTREVQHRVKNNLQIIISLLTLQAERAPNKWARDVLGQAKSRITALGLIHRLLYERGHDSEQGSVNMSELMNELCGQLRAENLSRPEISLSCRSVELTLSVDKAVPITLFIVEGFTNAFRHAFGSSDTGHISISLDRDADNARLTIADDGHGFSRDVARNKMGIDLMEAFASQLNAGMVIESTAKGTIVTLTLPLADG